jgi:hypothetical protein
VVDGWPHGVSWLSAHAMVERTNHVDDILDDTSFQNGLGINVADILPPVNERTATNVVDALTGLLVVDVTPAERTALIEYLDTVRSDAGVVSASPFVGSNQSHLDTRVRGLLWILAQHPGYQVR